MAVFGRHVGRQEMPSRNELLYLLFLGIIRTHLEHGTDLKGSGAVSRDIPKGDVPTLILAVLRDGPAHGYAIARAVERTSANVLRLREGSLYPALRVLEQTGHIVGAWETPPKGRPRKVYTLTKRGSTELDQRVRHWEAYAGAFGSILNARSPSNA